MHWNVTLASAVSSKYVVVVVPAVWELGEVVVNSQSVGRFVEQRDLKEEEEREEGREERRERERERNAPPIVSPRRRRPSRVAESTSMDGMVAP